MPSTVGPCPRFLSVRCGVRLTREVTGEFEIPMPSTADPCLRLQSVRCYPGSPVQFQQAQCFSQVCPIPEIHPPEKLITVFPKIPRQTLRGWMVVTAKWDRTRKQRNP